MVLHALKSLVAQARRDYYLAMSAVEILREVKALPSREREKLLSALLDLETKTTRSKTIRQRVKWPDVERRARHVFGNRIIPNLVLLEREEEAT